MPARKLARNAQGGFGFYVGLALRYKGEGIRTLRIDAELLSPGGVNSPHGLIASVF